MKKWHKIIIILGVIALTVVLLLSLLSYRPVPERITYGMSFNTLYAEELGLDWRETYDAIIEDLGVRHLRLAAHWDLIEPGKDFYDFSEIDYQVNEASARGVDMVVGVGRRLPRWPECHTPRWASDLSWEEQKVEIREMIKTVVNRYKDNENILYWQVENEPYLTVFGKEYCGEFDEVFLKEEIALVKELDPGRPILLTDSGNLGTWAGAYKNSDVFGTSVYVYFWNENVGPFKSVLPPAYYRLKYNLARLWYGPKTALLIELSAEPWLLQPIVETPIETQRERMNLEKFENIIAFARKTGFDTQYLWGAEWWYWLKEQGDDDFWRRAQELYKEE
ncbi:MAG: beta-galactosidase [Candidatus Pacebacteria bacterium]|nr:beta-galactosidase [Candidatus Paceibacterota bacterium]